MNIKLRELKEELKIIASNIRKLKIETKKYQRENGGTSGTNGYMLIKMRREYRHKHVAYCLIRGRTMQQIERHNKPWPFSEELDLNLIKIIREKYEEAIHIDSI